MTTITKTSPTSLTADHGILDEKARRVGGTIEVVELRRQLTPSRMEGNTYVPATFEDTGRFGLRQSATRNGESFGAYQGTKGSYDSLDAALAAGHKALIDQGKAYAKKYAKLTAATAEADARMAARYAAMTTAK